MNHTLRVKTIILSLVVNFFFSWTILPFVIPPFRAYSSRELVEVLMWQGMGIAGWPMGLLGGFSSLLLHHELTDVRNSLSLLIYPGMLFLLIHVLISRGRRRWELFLLHLLLTLSFGAVWFKVLNGYVFMGG